MYFLDCFTLFFLSDKNRSRKINYVLYVSKYYFVSEYHGIEFKYYYIHKFSFFSKYRRCWFLVQIIPETYYTINNYQYVGFVILKVKSYQKVCRYYICQKKPSDLHLLFLAALFTLVMTCVIHHHSNDLLPWEFHFRNVFCNIVICLVMSALPLYITEQRTSVCFLK